MDRCAGVVGIDPAALTLRELVAMTEAREQSEWARMSALLALIANVNRDARKTRAFKPSDFDPFAKREPVKNDIAGLRMLFQDKATGTGHEAIEKRQDDAGSTTPVPHA